jgi:hypothetical protein
MKACQANKDQTPTKKNVAGHKHDKHEPQVQGVDCEL